jgi:hypothetical protein
MLDRQTLRLSLPHQPSFIAFDRQQIALRVGQPLGALIMRQCGGIVAFGVYSASNFLIRVSR